jgi:hypothetical protein
MSFSSTVLSESDTRVAAHVCILGEANRCVSRQKEANKKTKSKSTMNKFTKIAVVAALAAMAAQGLRAQTAPGGDLILGFTSTSSSSDYVVDLGAIPTVPTDLGSAINLSQFGTGGAPSIGNMSVGVMFGKAVGTPGDFAGLSVPHGTAAPPTPSGNNVSAAVNDALSVIIGTPGNTTLTSFTGQSAFLTAGTFANSLGADPRVVMPGTSIVLDIYESTRLANSGRTTVASAFSLIGTLSLDLSGPTAHAEFTPTAVPEPSTYGLIAGAGLLLVVLRRRLSSQRA